MKVQTHCPSCEQRFKVEDEHVGRKGRCPACQSAFIVEAEQVITEPLPSPEPAADDQPRSTERPKQVKQQRLVPLSVVLISVAGGFVAGALTVAVLMTSFGRKSESVAPSNAVAKQQEPKPAAPIKKPPKISELFKTQLLTHIKAGGKLSSLTSQGVSVKEFGDQLATVRAELDLVDQTWPKDLDRGPLLKFRDSIEAYDLTLRLWEAKFKKLDEPAEPDINGWELYLAAGGNRLVIDTHPDDYLVPEYRGKRFLPFDGNIGVLMAIGSRNFTEGRDAILVVLE